MSRTVLVILIYHGHKLRSEGRTGLKYEKDTYVLNSIHPDLPFSFTYIMTVLFPIVLASEILFYRFNLNIY
jgi:hypothetical protein